jgi:hypothetical protein
MTTPSIMAMISALAFSMPLSSHSTGYSKARSMASAVTVRYGSGLLACRVRYVRMRSRGGQQSIMERTVMTLHHQRNGSWAERIDAKSNRHRVHVVGCSIMIPHRTDQVRHRCTTSVGVQNKSRDALLSHDCSVLPYIYLGVVRSVLACLMIRSESRRRGVILEMHELQSFA